VDALRVRASAAIDLVKQGLLDSDLALAHVVWPTPDVQVASDTVAAEGGRRCTPSEAQVRALELVDSGWSWAEAAREVGVAKGTVGGWIRKRKLRTRS
jgi:hypothetical protein